LISYFVYGPQSAFTSRKGDAASYTYDVRNRLLDKKWSTGLETTYSYDVAGRPVGVNNAAATIAYTYDAANRWIYEDEIVAGFPDNVGDATTTYDADGLRTNLTMTGVINQNYVYTPRGEVQAVGDDPQPVDAVYTYDLAGNRTQRTLWNGVTSLYQYDADNRLTQIADYANGATAPTFQFNYTLDQIGRISNVLHVHSGASVGYSYDLADRLTGSSNPDQTPGRVISMALQAPRSPLP
jgi:YD repeat-containing protein